MLKALRARGRRRLQNDLAHHRIVPVEQGRRHAYRGAGTCCRSRWPAPGSKVRLTPIIGAICWVSCAAYHRALARRPQAAGDMEQLTRCPSTRHRLHRQGRISCQRGHRADARRRGKCSWAAGSAAAAGSFRKAESIAASRVEEALFRELKEEIGLERRGRGGAGFDPRLAALSPAAAIRARPLHRAEAALVSAAGSSATNRSCGSIPPPRRNSTAGAGPTIGRRCARWCISSGGFTCARCTIWEVDVSRRAAALSRVVAGNPGGELLSRRRGTANQV